MPKQPKQPKTLGQHIRSARVEKGMALRELARLLERAPSYLNDIEFDRRTPSEDVLRLICKHLDLDFERMLGLAGRLGAQSDRYLRREPRAGVLFRKMSDADLDENEIQKLESYLDRLTQQKREKSSG